MGQKVRIAFLCAAGAAFFSMSVLVPQARAGTIYTIDSGAIPLSDLVGTGSSIQVGDKIFDTFTYGTSGADMPSVDDVKITPEIITVDGNTTWGFNISGAFHDTNSSGDSIANLGYSVSVVDPSSFLMNSAALLGDPFVVGTGTAQVTETWTPDVGPSQAQIDASLNSDVVGFTTLASSLTVNDNILAGIPDGASGNSALMSSIDQLYGQTPVPEPASLGLLAFGGLALMGRRRR